MHDKGIFKAVFLAGGPGSGKSFIVGKTALTALGLVLINSDDAFERQLAKIGLDTTPEDIFSPAGQAVRGKAKALTKLKQKLAIRGRLGLVIDMSHSAEKSTFDAIEISSKPIAITHANPSSWFDAKRNKSNENFFIELFKVIKKNKKLIDVYLKQININNSNVLNCSQAS